MFYKYVYMLFIKLNPLLLIFAFSHYLKICKGGPLQWVLRTDVGCEGEDGYRDAARPKNLS